MFYKLTAAVRRNRKWFIMLAGIIVFVTTYALILPAITIDKDTALDEPGLEVVLQDEETTLAEGEEETPEESEPPDDTGPSDDTEPPDETETSEPELPAVTLEETVGDVSVKVEAEEGVFPADTTMILNEVEDKESLDSIEDAVEDTVKDVQAVEVAFQNADGEAVEPQDKFTMTVEPVQPDEDASQVVVTLDEDGKTEIAEPEKNDTVELLILPEEVPVVAVVQTQELHTTLLTASGKTYEATVTFDQNAKIPEGSTLILTEFKEQSPAFQNAKQLVMEAGIIASESAVSTKEETNGLLDSTAFQPMSIGGGLSAPKGDVTSEAEAGVGIDVFDLAIFDNNGNEIEPAAPVQVELTVKSLPDDVSAAEFAATVKVTHLRETGEGIRVEVVAEDGDSTPGSIDVQKDAAVLTFETDSFSTYTVSWTNNNETNNVTVHYGYIRNNRFREFNESQFPNGVPNISYADRPNYLIYDVAGYDFSYATLGNPTGSNPQYLQPLLGRSSYSYYKADGTVENASYDTLSDGNQIYMVYTPKATPPHGGTPLVRESGTPPAPPEILKESKNNHDGTRTLSLSITGHEEPMEIVKLADVILVFDVSGSMGNNMDGGTASGSDPSRLARAKTAIKFLSDDLLSDQRVNLEGEKLIRMSLVTFSNTAQVVQPFTDDPAVYAAAVDSMNSGGGTNWERSLQVANEMAVDPDRATFVVFVTDGNPTWRMTRYNVSDATLRSQNDMFTSNTTGYYRLYNVFGQGNSDNQSRNYNAALIQAQSIVNLGKHFYSVGISNDPTNLVDFTEDAGVPRENSYTADNEEKMLDAFEDIIRKIEATSGFSHVDMIDGITGLTNLVAKTPITGVDAESFTYTRSYVNEQGQTVEDEPWDRTEDGQVANEAIYNEATGAVEWHMGDNFQLKDGVTYKVNFRVWPAQEATDIVTDLNNGLIEYDDLEPAIKEQLVKSGNIYTVKTNTDDAYVTYYKSKRTIDGVETIGDPQPPMYFQDVDPLVVSAMPVHLEKLWEDSFGDGEDRAEEVTLFLQRRPHGGSEEDWEDYAVPYINPEGVLVTSNEIRLSEANDWKATFYVAPGLIDAEGEECNTGHQYRIIEPELDYHYELNGEVVRPMYHGFHTRQAAASVHGDESHLVTELLERNVYINWEYEGDFDGSDSLSATNIVKGGINIGKIVMDYSGQHEIYSDDTFTIRGYILDPDGNPYTFNNEWDTRTDKSGRTGASPEWLEHQNDPLPYHTYDKDGNRTGYKLHFDSTADIVLHLKAGEVVRFPVIPQNCTFRFYEESSSMPENYELVRVNASHTIKDESGEYVLTPASQQPTVSSDFVVEGVVYGNSKHDVEFVNKTTIDTVEIRLLKVDNGNPDILLNGAHFELYLDEDHTEKAVDKDGNEIPTIITGGYLDEDETEPAGLASIGSLPYGTYYLVETVAPNGYFELMDHVVITVSNGGVDVLQTDNAQGSAGEATHYEGQGLVTFTVTNSSGKELPHTGGPGTLLYTSGGLFLMAAAMIYLICVRRRERRLE